VPDAQIQHTVCHVLVFKILITLDYKISYATVQCTAITMLCQNIKIVNLAHHNALIVKIIYLASHVLATLHGIIVVQQHYAPAHQDHSVICHNKMIA
jgi:hypothetical protein